jgi:hypothetical protein
MAPSADRSPNLIAWQWSTYASAHRSRANLVLHALTVPLFLAGTIGVVASPFTHGWSALGAVGMVLALALQGRGHAGEDARPIPFASPWDFVARFFSEQWVNFPRFVLSGGFAAAWRAGAPGSSPSPAP